MRVRKVERGGVALQRYWQLPETRAMVSLNTYGLLTTIDGLTMTFCGTHGSAEENQGSLRDTLPSMH